MGMAELSDSFDVHYLTLDQSFSLVPCHILTEMFFSQINISIPRWIFGECDLKFWITVFFAFITVSYMRTARCLRRHWL